MILIRSRHAASSHEGAFTLIELLLGLAIAGIIGLSVYSLFWSGIKLDDKSRRAHENAMEVLIADQGLTKDVENAINLDLSANYPALKVFEGHKNEMAFLIPTATGINRVRYFSGMVDFGKVTKTLVGRKLTHLSPMTSADGSLPIEFLLRQETSLVDWANQKNTQGPVQIVAAGLKKGTFNCQYAAFNKDIYTQGPQAVKYEDRWDNKKLPMAVRCGFVVYDPAAPQTGMVFKRDMFLAPLWLGNESG